MEARPGEEVQVDFGLGAPIWEGSGRPRRSWVFRMVLSYSRKAYSEAVLRQDTETFLLLSSCRYWISRAATIGEECGQWAQGSFELHGAQALRSIMGLCALSKQHSASAIDSACSKALKAGSNLHFFSSLSRFSKNRRSGFCRVRASAYHRKSGPLPSFLGAGMGRPGRRVPGGNRPTLHPRAEHLSALAQPQDRHAWRLRLLGSTQRPAKNRSGPERLHVTLRIIWPRILPTIWHHREGILFGGRPWLLGSNLRDH
jgi:hypothetical protein